ncbi:hypothetical protein Lhac_0410 [Legionella hackeliae]|nr:hypothetical protein Lhac_0410 [Legionella hackeliae]
MAMLLSTRSVLIFCVFMFVQIQAFLSMLAKQPANYELDAAEWFDITEWYSQSDDDTKNYLVQGLALHSQINKVLIHTHLALNSSYVDVFNQLQREALSTAKAKFIQRTKKNLPQIDELELNDIQWLELLRRFSRNNSSRLTTSFLIHHLSEIHPTFVKSITKQQKETAHPRQAKPTRDHSHLQPKAKRRKYDGKADISSNCLILEDDSRNQDLHVPLAKQGVRVTSLKRGTPEKHYSDVRRTPGGRKIGLFWTHKTKGRRLDFFKPLTPSPKKVALTQTAQDVNRKIPQLRLFCNDEPIYFKTTLEKLEQREPTRRFGQNQLTGVSCQSLFAAYNPTIIIERCSKYHWSHLIAHYFGGDQSITNLVPTTSAANYNILDVIEHFIAKKLIDDKVAEVNICVEPIYDDNPHIPSNLKFSLTWVENDKTHEEIIRISPRSQERFTRATLQSIHFIREQFKNLVIKESTADIVLEESSGLTL